MAKEKELVEIKALKDFPINKLGWVRKGKSVKVNKATADYCVKKMKSAVFVKK